eukprot:gene7062-5002_t
MRPATFMLAPLSAKQAALRELLSGTVMSSHAPRGSLGVQDARCRANTRGSSTASHSPYTAVPCDIFEGNNKQAWLDLRSGFCHLCQEPLGSSMGVHVGDRDHTNLQYFLYLYASYPRGDTSQTSAAFTGLSPLTKGTRHGGVAAPADVQAYTRRQELGPAASTSSMIASGGGGSAPANRQRRGADSSREAMDAAQQHYMRGPRWDGEAVRRSVFDLCPSLYAYATTHIEMDHLHTVDDARRRAELEALLRHLQGPPHFALSHVLQGRSPLGFWYSGEKMWKFQITKIATQMFPPLSAGMMTNFTQKCWGRSNGERTYDALRLADMQAAHGWGPYEGKEKKTFFLRQMIWELLSVEVREEVDELAKHLAGLALRRLAFEMVFLQCMDYMHRIQDVFQRMGNPTTEELLAMNLL